MLRSALGSIIALLVITLTFQPPLAFAGEAMLEIDSHPTGADIYIDGTHSGTTPGFIDVSAGKHRITVRKKSYLDVTRNLTLSDGQMENINIKLSLDPSYQMKADRARIIKSYLSSYQTYSNISQNISSLKRDYRVPITSLAGEKLKEEVSPKLKEAPKWDNYKRYKDELNYCQVAFFPFAVVITMGLGLIILCLPKQRKRHFYNSKPFHDEEEYNKHSEKIREYNKQARIDAAAQNAEIRRNNIVLQKKLDSANAKVKEHNASIDRKIRALKAKSHYEQLIRELDKNAVEILRISKKLGDKVPLPTNPNLADYAKAFKRLQ